MKIPKIAFIFLFGCTSAPHKIDSNTPSISALRTARPPVLTVPITLVKVNHEVFEVLYDPTIRSARYVKYVSTAANLKIKKAKRKNKFIADPKLAKMGLPHVKPKEYLHSGYDQGHLAPSADFSYNQQANDITFVMSNMSPQSPKLNRVAWRMLEEKVREWTCGEGQVKVISGPIFDKKPKTLKSGLPIPTQYFKILVDETPPRKILAFIYNQTDSTNVIGERISSVDQIEARTGLKFDNELPLEIIPTLRAPSSIQGWREADCG